MVGVILQLLPLGSQYHAKNNYWCNHEKKPKNLIFNSTSNYSMHGLDYRSRAMTVAHYLASQLVGLTCRVVGPSGRLPPPEGVARPALVTPKCRGPVWGPFHLRKGPASYISGFRRKGRKPIKQHIYIYIYRDTFVYICVYKYV